MRTVIVRLSEPAVDGRLHGLVEVVGDGGPRPFTDDDALVRLLHAAAAAETGPGPDGDGPDGQAT